MNPWWLTVLFSVFPSQELFPVNRQSVDHFAKYFTDAGLKELSDFLRVQQSLGTRKELQKELQERLSQECPIKEVGTAGHADRSPGEPHALPGPSGFLPGPWRRTQR